MCDYSLHAVASRPAEAGDKLVSTSFCSTATRGFAAEDNLQVAVCLRPGTEVAFEDNVRFQRGYSANVGDRMARFREINTDKINQHHDALEFSNGTVVLVTELAIGQRACVLQLPVDPVENTHSQETSSGRVPNPAAIDRLKV